MPFVLDASVAVTWALAEGGAVAASAHARLRRDVAVAQSLWWFKVRNALVMNMRLGRIAPDDSDRFMDALVRFVQLDREPVAAVVVALARDHRLTVYDAAYIELAQRRRCPLATLDRATTQAAAAKGISYLDA